MSASTIAEYSIRTLFSSGRYVIPLYQRNYAWREKEILQLIQDIADYAKNKPETIYRIGTLIAFERVTKDGRVHETIDGQQRLTTLNILLCVLKREYPSAKLRSWFKLNLEYDSRPSATEALRALFQNTPSVMFTPGSNVEIHHAYDVVFKGLREVLKDWQLGIEAFIEYLIYKVSLLFVAVPPDTDLNHYFEIMNSRGEQLEKHEVLKAELLEVLKDDPGASYSFNLIWESCADMERNVQFGFNTAQRTELFGHDWSLLVAPDFDSVHCILIGGRDTGAQNEDELSFEDLLGAKPPVSKVTVSQSGADVSFRFNSIINFPNFLLQILRIQVAREESCQGKPFEDWDEVRLDDKDLLDAFHNQLKKCANLSEKRAFVVSFAYNLLRGKNLLDTYILRREFVSAGDRWSLKSLKKSQSDSGYYVDTFDQEDKVLQKEILMMLAMFHVSNPTLIYKHWLNAALRYLFDQDKVHAASYNYYLKRFANALLFNRFLTPTDSRKDYYEMIYKPNGLNPNSPTDATLLHQGVAVENFIFNYLDFLLWKMDKEKYQDFEFTFRSSVEHYYPQNPLSGTSLEDQYLHHFGNLCLISSSKNSALKNYLPQAKKDHYQRVKPDSIKQRLMMDAAIWDSDQIIEHGDAMKSVLLRQKPRGCVFMPI